MNERASRLTISGDKNILSIEGTAELLFQQAMTISFTPVPTRRQSHSIWLMGLSLISFSTFLLAAPKDDWPAISPEELASTASPQDPEAPAEILYRRIEIDLREAPVGRTETDYIRYKIYAPEKSDAYTRVSRLSVNSGSSYSYTDLNITARLTLPDGSVSLFTKNDLKDRPYLRGATDSSILSRLFGGGDYSLNEKFLAVTGVLPGSILEYRISEERGSTADYTIVRDGNFSTIYPLQNRDLPCRKVDFIGRTPKDSRYPMQNYVLNRSIGQSTQQYDKNKGIITVTATNVPPSHSEPLTGPVASYTLSVLQCINDTETQLISRTHSTLSSTVTPGTDGPWAPIANRSYMLYTDYSEVTSKIKKTSAQITASAQTPLEKARAIHDYAQDACEKFRRHPRPTTRTDFRWVSSIDDILQWITDQKTYYYITPTDFLHLANALYKAAGFETRGIRLPDRSRFPFSPQLVAADCLPIWALQVKIDGQWVGSMPHYSPLIPFATLPSPSEGLLGLVAKSGKQELVEIPNSKAAVSKIINTATLILLPDGTLEGEATRKYTGHHATAIRSRLLKKKNPTAAKKKLQAILLADLADSSALSGPSADADDDDDDTADTANPAEQTSVKITKLKGDSDTASALEVTYTFRIPGYALISPERIILRPSVYRAKDKSPFSSATRTNAIRFDFAWQEIDNLTLKLPEGFVLESPALPEADAGPILFHRHRLTYDPATQTLNYRREFFCEATFFPASQYPVIKAWFDTVNFADHQEIILSKSAPAAPSPINQAGTTPAGSS